MQAVDEAPSFGRALRQLRLRQGISLAEMSRLTNYSRGYLSKIENGHRLPHAEIARLFDKVLGGDGELAGLISAAPAARRSFVIRPAQLPSDTASFTGRAGLIAQLNGLLTRQCQSQAVTIAMISGTPGVGKTTLAVHWTHLVTHLFPDGQLYVNLRGYDPSGTPVTSAEAIRGFLDAFSVPPSRVPVALDAQTAMYRSLLADKRVLVLLDNARDASQIRPLLPGSPGCFVVVTSRSQFTGLVASAGARPLVLDLLTAVESRELLERHLGPGTVATEPDAVQELIELCAGLPLALALAAAQAATNPQLTLPELTAQLRRAHSRLDALQASDPVADVRGVFSWSYQNLAVPAMRMFRFIGLHLGPDLSATGAASLAGIGPEDARQALGELARAHLLTEVAPGRYACHDLLRIYALELARRVDDDRERHDAIHRMLDHYRYSAHSAALLLNPARQPLTLPAPEADVRPDSLTGLQEAGEWFEAEHRVLRAVIAQAAETGFDAHAWQLAWSLADFYNQRGHWQSWAATQEVALAAAKRLGDPQAQSRVNHYLGYAQARLGSRENGRALLMLSLNQFRRLGDHANMAHVHLTLAITHQSDERAPEALAEAELALRWYRIAGHRAGQANAMNAVGWYHSLLGNQELAVTFCQQALDLHRELGNAHGEAATWDSLGYALHQMGQHMEALACYRRCLDLQSGLGERYLYAESLVHIGDCHHIMGDPLAARRAWEQAITIFDELQHPDGDAVRAKLYSIE